MKIQIEGDVKSMNKLHESQGFWMTWGVMRAIGLLMLAVYIIGALVYALTPTDDTDLGKFSRSGLKIITDKGTGCEYLVSQHGGIILRRPCNPSINN